MAEYTLTEYQGGISSLNPEQGYEGFTGYRAPAGSLTMGTDPRTANIIKEVSTKLSGGTKNIELTQFVTPKIMDSIPKQQLKEVNQLSKLTGIDLSVHGPVIDSAGMTQQGWSEVNRESNERTIIESLNRAHEINPDKGIPVVFHSSEGIPGTEWKEIPWKEKEIEGKARQLIAVNRESGQMAPLKEENKFYPGQTLKPGVEEKYNRGEITDKQIGENPERYFVQGPSVNEVIHSPEEMLEIQNHSSWDNEISQLFFNKERADEILQKNAARIQHIIQEIQEKKLDPSKGDLSPDQQEAWNKYKDVKNYLDDTNMHARLLFSKAYKYGDSRQRKKLEELNEQYKKDLDKNETDIMAQSRAMHKLLSEMQYSKNHLAPRMFVPMEEFATEQSSKTFGNAAFQSYKKYKDKAPVIVIENPPVGHALSTGEDLKNLVIESRKNFAKQLIETEGVDKKQAEKTAEKLIGATWDVGHINILRKQGFDEKQIIEETEKIAPFVKHVHLSDNFGFEHTELPMGMGNVPMKEIMEKLGKKGFEAKKVIEAADWWQHFQTNPARETFEGLGSPIYSEGTGPYWNQSSALYQNYFGGYGMMLPQTNYQLFGAGFSQLPAELGGQVGGGQQGSRMSGRPME